MADRGIDVVRAHLAKLPPSDSLTVAERRAQYERAEKVFPTPPEIKVERVSAPVAPAEWLRPPGAVAGRGGKLLRVTNLNDSGAGSLRDFNQSCITAISSTWEAAIRRPRSRISSLAVRASIRSTISTACA